MAQIGFRQIVHAMPMQARVHRIRHQHRVIERCHPHAVAGKDLPIIFHVLADL